MWRFNGYPPVHGSAERGASASALVLPVVSVVSVWPGLPSLSLFACFALFAGACAKSPTTVIATLSVDGTVAPLLALNSSVTSNAAPNLRSTAGFVSLARGDAADRPAPYQFPLDLKLTVPGEFGGPVTITIEGLDWDTSKVIARGTGIGIVQKEQSTYASIVLTAVGAVTPSDGGLGDATDGAADAAALEGREALADGGAPEGG